MSYIFDRLGRPSLRFRPTTTREFLVLQVARKLGAGAEDLLSLTDRYSDDVIVRAYRRALKAGNGFESPQKRFERELAALDPKEDYGQSQTGRSES